MLKPRPHLSHVEKITILVLFAIGVVCGAPIVNAQCPPTTTLVAGLEGPTKLIQIAFGQSYRRRNRSGHSKLWPCLNRRSRWHSPHSTCRIAFR